MTREEAIAYGKRAIDLGLNDETQAFCELAIKALEQEPRKDEIILTKEEYGELVSSEFDIGYTKGYTEALEQNDVLLDKIRAEIEQLQTYKMFIGEKTVYVERDDVLAIIDKHKGESEE